MCEECADTTTEAEGQQQGTEQPQEAEQQPQETDWKAESRKWERRAKENAEKARAYDESAAKAKTTEERLVAVEAERDKLAAEKGRKELVNAVAEKAGVDASLVAMLSGADEQSLSKQAAALAEAVRPRTSSVVSTDGDAPERDGRPNEMRSFVHALMSPIQ